VVVGIALAVIVGALVLTADWGYGLATRRAAQNQADAAALAAGRVLASSYDGASPAFATTQEDAWNAACEARNANTPNAPVSQDPHPHRVVPRERRGADRRDQLRESYVHAHAGSARTE
jgi:hypothetical protein